MITSSFPGHVPQLAAEKCLSMGIDDNQSFRVHAPRASIQLIHRHNPCSDNHDNHQSPSHEGKSFTRYEFEEIGESRDSKMIDFSTGFNLF
jgi:hypothetical protein